MTEATRKRRRRRRWFRDMTAADYILSIIGLFLGTVAALFPWHVYFNPERYGPPRMEFSRGGVIPEAEILALQSGQMQFDRRTGRFAIPDDRGAAVDTVTTGTVNREERPVSDLDQAFPGNGAPFEVLAMDRARALVGDSHGIYLVRPRDRLPDGSRAVAFRSDDQGWYILTSDKRILRPR